MRENSWLALLLIAKVDGLNVFYPAVIEQAKLPLS